MELQIVPRSITRVSGGRGLGWQLVPRCLLELRHRSFVQTKDGCGLGFKIELQKPPPYRGGIMTEKLETIAAAEPEKKRADTDIHAEAPANLEKVTFKIFRTWAIVLLLQELVLYRRNIYTVIF